MPTTCDASAGMGLQCPACQGRSLQHQSVIRNGTLAPDTERGVRRVGLRIQFTCETCADRPVLLIFQRQGITCVRWTAP